MYLDLKGSKVFFHKNCNDGMGAAVALYDKMPIDTIYSPIQYGDEIVIEDDISEVIFVDYTPKVNEIVDVLNKLPENGRLIILDHHSTGVNNINAYLNEYEKDERLMFYTDQDKCGALICYSVRKPSEFRLSDDIIEIGNIKTNMNPLTVIDPYVINGSFIHEFYTLLDIRDRWIDIDTNSKKRADDLSTFLYVSGWTSKDVAENVNILKDLKPSDLEEMVKAGSYFNDIKTKQAENLVKKAVKLDVVDKNGKIVKLAITFTDDAVSDSGSIWSKENEKDGSLFVGVMVIPDQEVVVLSTRSNKLASAKAFCEVHGGGGHLQAAGCKPEGLFNKSPKEVIDMIVETIATNTIVL